MCISHFLLVFCGIMPWDLLYPLQLTLKQQELKTLLEKYAESQSQLAQTTDQLEALRIKHATIELEVSLTL